jgi:hypothetical protein
MLASERAENARATLPKESIYFFTGDQKMKLWILGLTSALLVLSNPEARASMVTLDWSTVPVPQRHLEPTITPPGPNGVYTTGSDFSGVLVKVAGSNFAPAGLHNPKIDEQGHPFSMPVLSTAANFKSSGGIPTVTFTLDFFGFKQGVKNVSFELFDVDAVKRGGSLVQDVVTFQTAGLGLIGSKDNVVNGETVTGTGRTGPESTDEPGGDVAVHSLGNLPLHQIVFNWRELGGGGPGSESLDEIAIGNIRFTPVPEYGQLVIGFVACLLGAFWLVKSRRKKAHSIS